MASTFGTSLKLTIFGESHGAGVGVVLDGLPPGLALDEEAIRRDLLRRAPGRDDLSSAREESDRYEILSGLYDGTVTGAPLCAFFRNTDVKSDAYEVIAETPRPGHADYTQRVKYGGHADLRGGGTRSGRLTAGLVFAGAVAKQYLGAKGIVACAKVDRVCTVSDEEWEETHLSPAFFSELNARRIPTVSTAAAMSMEREIAMARESGDSLGCALSAVAIGLPAGLGDPFFDSFESMAAHLLFSIPAVKGVSFGAGFRFSEMRGSEANDPFVLDANGTIQTATNHSGGCNGGMTNGMPLVVRVALRPPPSIALPQKTVNLNTLSPCEIELRGRHDPCLAPRAVPVLEGALAITILDRLLEANKWTNC
ncbi:chorismate synthase [Oscillospiraceae bacterium OttesenSCG-928-G22]|nr:chorismate synthase [Oscillospiraceae bacterium OttesenSCG-928-G22]